MTLRPEQMAEQQRIADEAVTFANSGEVKMSTEPKDTKRARDILSQCVNMIPQLGPVGLRHELLYAKDALFEADRKIRDLERQLKHKCACEFDDDHNLVESCKLHGQLSERRPDREALINAMWGTHNYTCSYAEAASSQVEGAIWNRKYIARYADAIMALQGAGWPDVAAINSLRPRCQVQADQDGVMVKVSRQACDHIVEWFDARMPTPPEGAR